MQYITELIKTEKPRPPGKEMTCDDIETVRLNIARRFNNNLQEVAINPDALHKYDDSDETLQGCIE